MPLHASAQKEPHGNRGLNPNDDTFNHTYAAKHMVSRFETLRPAQRDQALIHAILGLTQTIQTLQHRKTNQ